METFLLRASFGQPTTMMRFVLVHVALTVVSAQTYGPSGDMTGTSTSLGNLYMEVAGQTGCTVGTKAPGTENTAANVELCCKLGAAGSGGTDVFPTAQPAAGAGHCPTDGTSVATLINVNAPKGCFFRDSDNKLYFIAYKRATQL